MLPLFASIALAIAADRRSPERAALQLEQLLRSTSGESFGAFTKAQQREVAEQILALPLTDVPDHLLLAVLLMGGVSGDPVETALRMLVATQGNVSTLRDRAAALGVEGIGEARLAAGYELFRRGAVRSSLALQVSEPIDVWRIFRGLSSDPGVESLMALYLDRRNRVLAVERLGVGSDAFCIVDPRVIARPAIAHNATGVILGHNHPSGDPGPSQADAECTSRIQAALRTLGIRLIDHLVVTPVGFTSFAERGDLPSWDSAMMTTT